VNVLVVCSTDYPDMDEVRKRLEIGASKPQHTTFVRNGDHQLKAILKGIGVKFEVYEWQDNPEFGVFIKGTDNYGGAYNESAFNFCDKIIVYCTDRAGVTDYFVKRAKRDEGTTRDKTEIIRAKTKVARVKRKSKPQTEA